MSKVWENPCKEKEPSNQNGFDFYLPQTLVIVPTPTFAATTVVAAFLLPNVVTMSLIALTTAMRKAVAARKMSFVVVVMALASWPAIAVTKTKTAPMHRMRWAVTQHRLTAAALALPPYQKSSSVSIQLPAYWRAGSVMGTMTVGITVMRVDAMPVSMTNKLWLVLCFWLC